MIADTRLTKIVTTLPHLVAAWIAASTHPWYATLVAVSTAASALWHAYDDPYDSLYLLDHGLAFVWGVTDFWLWPPSIIFNGTVLALHPGLVPPPSDYMFAHNTWDPMTHAEWHLLSAIKAIGVATLLATAGSG